MATAADRAPGSSRWRGALIVVGLPVLVRVALALVLDDFDGDGYSRALIAEDLAAALREGRATWHHLYVAVWPPAWAIACAAADLAGADPYLGPKLLSALFGGLTAALAWDVAGRLGADRPTRWIAWGLMTASPLHLLYSATAMSEAFYGCWFLLAIACFLRAAPGTGWLAATAAALLPAALTRFDVWILLPALPVLALAQRRTTLAGAALVTPLFALGPLAWFALNWVTRGDPLHFTAVHGAYVRSFFEFHRIYADRGLVGTGIHLGAILSAAGLAITPLGVVGLWRRARASREARALAVILGVAFGYLLVLWILRRQVGWRRHYLAIGSGLTVTAAFVLTAARGRARRVLAVVVALDLVALGAVDVWMARWPRRQRQAADWVAVREGAIYCDDPAVRVLSGQPRGRFVDYLTLPKERDGALAHLRARGVRWIVFADVDYSPLPSLFPELRQARDAPPFRLAFTPAWTRPLPRLLVYELLEAAPARAP